MSYYQKLGSDAQTFTNSIEVEMFLKTVLKLHDNLKAEIDLKDCYKSIVEYERGEQPFLKPAQFKKLVKLLLRYFKKAIDKIAKTNPEAVELKDELMFAQTAEEIWDLYEELKGLRDAVA